MNVTGKLHSFLNAVNGAITWVPAQAWAALIGALLVTTIVAFPIARRGAYRAGQRTAGHKTTNVDRRDQALFIAAITPAFLFLIAVLAGSQRGLVAFGKDDLHWKDGWEYLVPATLDGVGVAFGFLAFRAVRKHRSPDRAVRVAWGAAFASGIINFTHEANLPDGSTLGGAYLAFLSLMVMVMFHELLDQFVEGAAYIKRVNPAFKMRWLTWPTNTACAWVAWRNYPVDVPEGTPVTVKLAVDHLDRVRATKRDLRRLNDLEAVASGVPSWTRVMPWIRARMFDAKLTAERSAWDAERVQLADRLSAVEAEQANGAAHVAALAEQAEQHRTEAVHLAEQLATEQAEHQAVQAKLAAAEQARAANGAAVAGSGDSHSEQPERAERSGGAARRGARTVAAPNAPKLTDDEALQEMLRAHPGAAYEWTKREVHRITGAGFGRVDRLIVAIAEHHRSTAGAGSTEQAEDKRTESAG
jgi:hypothetical protein